MPITVATIEDVAELNNLVNAAYRGETSKQGWTTEADMLDGMRIDEETLQGYFHDPAVTLLKNVGDEGQITGSVYLEVVGDKLYIGMFSVSPQNQGKQIGRSLLEAAEDFARKQGLPLLTMTVISTRHELINWYERRGFKATGEILPFHVDKKFGLPKQPIQLAVLEKSI